MYDPWVVGFMALRVWKTGSDPGIEAYRKHMGRRHLDVGPETGYFIIESEPPALRALTPRTTRMLTIRIYGKVRG